MVSRDKSRLRTADAARRGGSARLLRIIGGRWRGRKLRFPASSDIRPTPDRVRETLFNWLAASTQGASCLDLFAGSGALGLEALSRGATHVTFVEHDAVAARELRARLEEWHATNAQVVCMDALRYLSGATAAADSGVSARPRPFDIVFLDPPFRSHLLEQAAALLESHAWLKPAGLIYVESPARVALPSLPQSWRLLRAKRAGEVGYHLLAHTAPEHRGSA